DMRLERARWWGAAAGIVLALLDTLTISALGVRFELSGHDVSPLVAAWFGSSFVLLGFLVGYVVEGRRRDRGQAEVIRAQTEAIAATRARLAQTEKLAALGQLAAAVAHEVRSPLAVIRSAAQGLAESVPRDDEEARRAYSFITAEIDRLGNVVNSLLAFARPLRVDARPVSVHELFDRALLLAHEELQGKALRVRRDEPPLLPEVRADGDLICQVLLGLLANAAEAAPRRPRVRDVRERRGGAHGPRGARRRRGGDRLEDARDGRHRAPPPAARTPAGPARDPRHRARHRPLGGRGHARGRLRLRHQAVRQRRAARHGRARARDEAPRAREPLAPPGGGEPLRARGGDRREPGEPGAPGARPPRGAEPRHGADPGRERDGEGAGRPPAPLL